MKKDNNKPTIEEIWEYTKRNFKIGKDYIETETEDYIVFCPFNYNLLSYFSDVLNNIKEIFNYDGWVFFDIQHCVTRLDAFIHWYRELYQDGRIKTFFLRKDIDISMAASEYALPTKNGGDCLIEFTGWIDFNDRNFLYFAHLVDNSIATGEYINFTKEGALSRKVTKGKKRIVEKICKITSEVYDNLFAQYDVHINELEETLFNTIEP